MKKMETEITKISVGIDLHKNSWELQPLTPFGIQKRIHLSPPSADKLEAFLKKNYPNCEYLCAYEAGFSGFWLQRQLEDRGIKTIVVHPADIPTTDKERRFKTDKVDCKKIAKALRANLLTGIYVPSEIQQKDRSLVRERYRIIADQRRIKCRIRSYQVFAGIEIEWPDHINENGWSKAMLEYLESYAKSVDDSTLEIQIEMLRYCHQVELSAMRKIRDLAKAPRYIEQVKWLRSIKGVGLLTVMVFLTEIGDIERFKNLDQLACYIGIVPGSASSGDTDRKTKLTKRGNKFLRTALILSAWMALFYAKWKPKKGSQKAIIKVARKLLSRIRYVLINQTELS